MVKGGGPGFGELIVKPETKQVATNRSAQPRWVSLFFLAVIVASIPLRVPQIGQPLQGWHRFRQTQTAITVWSFTENGVHPLGYQTPVLGPPWRIPMEFPSFQMTAALGVGFGLDIDTSCRLTNLFFFYLCAALLFILCRILAPGSRVAELAVAFFCWMPFNIYWSAQSMIDFAAVAFALGYAVAFAKWMEAPTRFPYFPAALAAGTLAYLTKVTTMVAFVPLIGTLILVVVLREIRSAGSIATFVRMRPKFLAGVTVLVLAPVLFEQAWLIYCDHVKAGSPFTAWLTSGNLGHWTFGSLEQRLDPGYWKIIGNRLGFALPPFLLTALSVLGFASLRLQDPRGRAIILAAVTGVVAPIAVFFNLYAVHDYYLMAVTAPLAIVVGFGGNHLLFQLLGKHPVSVVCLLAVVAYISTRVIYPPPEALTIHEYRLAMHLREITEPEELIVVAEKDWNPFILYHARRRGFMLRGSGYGSPAIDEHEITRFLKENEFSVIVSADRNHWLTKKWKNKVYLPSIPGFFVYRVDDAVPAESFSATD